jgi:hypothetical protein
MGCNCIGLSSPQHFLLQVRLRGKRGLYIIINSKGRKSLVEHGFPSPFSMRIAGLLKGSPAAGEPVTLNKGDTGYVAAGRIHDAKYIEECKLVYVHDKAFGFTAEG